MKGDGAEGKSILIMGKFEENLFSRIGSTVVYEIYIVFLVTSVETVMRMSSTTLVKTNVWAGT